MSGRQPHTDTHERVGRRLGPLHRSSFFRNIETQQIFPNWIFFNMNAKKLVFHNSCQSYNQTEFKDEKPAFAFDTLIEVLED